MEKSIQELILRLNSDAPLTREFTVVREGIDEEKRTVEIAFSSEEPYRRWFGDEILGHADGEVIMDFMASGRAPLLDSHDHGRQLGVIESARIDPDRRGRAVVRFSRNPAADEVFKDILDGIKGNISVGYRVLDMVLQESSDEKGDTYRVTSWQPLEASVVSIPADTSVGVGRSAETPLQRGVEMPNENKPATTPEAVDPVAIRNETRAAEVLRIREISALGKMHGYEEAAEKAIAEDKTLDQFRAYVLEALGKKGLTPVDVPDASVGLSEKETKAFSFVRAFRALANPTDRRAQEEAAFEFEASEAVSKVLQRTAQGIMVPLEVMKRDLVVGTPTAGGNLVATNLLAGSFIDMLRNAMALVRMGTTTLTGLVGDIAIPRQTGGATAYWVAESGDPTESQQAFDQVGMTPKTVGAFTDISRKLLKQSSIDVENFVRGDLARALALAIDLAGITGSGSNNQPTGVLNTSGIGLVVGGDNGAAPEWADVVGLWSQVAQDNAAFGSLGFLTNTSVIGKLMTTEKATGTAQFVCKDFPDAQGMTSLAGSRCGVSNQVPANLTKGTADSICSAILYGNWADLIVGMWGTLDLTVDPYSLSTQGAVRIVALQDVDVAVRHPESFAAMKDALTA